VLLGTPPYVLVGQPANMARWAQAVVWRQGEATADAAIRRINDGDAGTTWELPAKPSQELSFGLRWEEARSVRKIVVRWHEKAPDYSAGWRLEHWVWGTWGSPDWHMGHDWWHGKWAVLGGEPKIEGNAWTFQLAEPIQTLQFCLRPPPGACASVAELEAYTDSVWQAAAVEIEWGFAGAARARAFDGRLEAYNGHVISIQPLDAGTKMKGPASWISRGPHPGRRGVRAELLRTPGGVLSRDRTVVTVCTRAGNFSFLPSDTESGPVYVPDLGFLVSKARSGESAAKFLKNWEAAGNNTIIQRTREAREQSLARAREEQRWPPVSATIIRCNRDTMPYSIFWVSHDGTKIGDHGLALARIEPGPGAALERQWWLDNYLPVLNTRWNAGDLTYDEELFGTTLDDGQPVILMGLSAANHAKEPAAASWKFAYPGWQLGPQGALRSKDGRPLVGGFIDTRGQGELSPAEGADAVSYDLSLRPGERHTIWLMLPAVGDLTGIRVGMPSSKLPRLRALNPDAERQKVAAYWKAIVERAMRVDVPEQGMGHAWKAGIVQLLMYSESLQDGTYDLHIGGPYGTWESESVPIAQVMDMVGLRDIAAKGLEHMLAGQSKAKPIGRFRTVEGCLCALAPCSCEGPGFVLEGIADHYSYTRDARWLRRVLPKVKAGCEWILRERELEMKAIAEAFPGQKIWGYGLAPPGMLGDPWDWRQMFFQNGYYHLGLLRCAEALAGFDPRFSARLAREAKDYRRSILEALHTGIALSPVIRLLNGAYSPVAPPFPHNRGLCRQVSQWGTYAGYVYDMEAGPLHLVDSRVVAPEDRRVGWMLDVLEDVVCADGAVFQKKPGYDPQRDWPSYSGFGGQSYYQHLAMAHLKRDDIPNFLRVFYNSYAAHADPQTLVFREHVAGGAPYKTHEQAWFMQQFRYMLVMEEGRELRLAMGTPRAWLEDGRYLRVKDAATFFGPVSFAIESDADDGVIRARVEMPSRSAPDAVVLRLRHPRVRRLSSVEVNGKAWKDFDPRKETIRLSGLKGEVSITARYGGRRSSRGRP
jgi:hypothetical protein